MKWHLITEVLRSEYQSIIIHIRVCIMDCDLRHILSHIIFPIPRSCRARWHLVSCGNKSDSRQKRGEKKKNSVCSRFGATRSGGKSWSRSRLVKPGDSGPSQHIRVYHICHYFQIPAIPLFYFPPRFCVCFFVMFVDFLFKPYSHRDQLRAFGVQIYVASQQQITSRAEYDYLHQYEW